MRRTIRWYVQGLILWAALAAGACGEGGRPPVLDLPATPEELIERCRLDPSLSSFARHGEVLTSGLQVLLLGTSVSIGDSEHVAWARPYYRGPVRILAFLEAPHYREIAALSRALQGELAIVQMPPGSWFESVRKDLYQGFSAETARKALKKPWDVIVLCSGLSSGPQHLPADIQSSILEKVKQGTGLVLQGCYEAGGGHPVAFWPEKTPFEPASGVRPVSGRVRINPLGFSVQERQVADGLPLALLPPVFALPVRMESGWKAALLGGKAPAVWRYTDKPEAPPAIVAEGEEMPLVVIGEHGRGRVVSTAWATNGGFPVVDGNDMPLGIRRYEEYWTALLCKLVLWAAGRPSELLMRLDAPSDAPPEGGTEVKVFLEGLSARKFSLKLDVRVRDWKFREVWREGRPAALSGAATQTAIVRLPPLPAGLYAVDVVARTPSGESVNWASAALQVRSPERIEMALPRDTFSRDDTVEIRVKGSGLQRGSYRARVRVVDSFGRVVRDEEGAVGPGNDFTVLHPLRDARSCLHTAEAVLTKDGQPRAQAVSEFSCPEFRWDDFHNILWGDAEHAEILRDWAGVDTYLAAGWPGHEFLARAGAEAGLKLLWTNVAPQSPEQTQREPEKAEVAFDEQVDRAGRWINRYDAIGVCFQDERHSFQDPAPNEVCLARFRAWLKEQYGDLERLNATWETTHKAWEEVRPLLTAEFRPERNNLAPWLDFRLFVSKLTMDVDARQAESLRRRTSPDLFIGIEGVFGLGGHIVPYSGFDYAEHARRCFNMIMPYDNEVNSVTNLARSFCPGPLSTWDGYSAPRWQYEAKPWWGALHGYWGMSWFCSKTLATSTGCLFPQAFWVEEATRKLRQGVGKLLMTSEMQTDPVVFLYSQPSLYAAYVAGHWINPQNKHLMNRPSTQWGRENLQRLVNEFGLQYSYVSDRQVEAGALRGKKLLILPDVMCMSQKTAEAIEEFVRGGGVVLADLCPALWDEHGRPLRPGRLDRLFGVTRDRFEYGTRPTDYLIGTTQSEPDFPVANEWFIGEYYERGLKVDGGKALGAHIFDETEVPAFVLNRTGLGAALLMNFLETNYSRYPEGRQRVFMRALLGLAKIEPPVRVLNEHGAELYQYDVTRFEDGGHLYVGVYRLTTSSPLNPEEVTLRLPRPGHLYEVKSGNDLGEGRDARVKLRAADSALVAVLPYRVEGVKARAASARAGEPVVVSAAVQASTGRPGRHILHLQVEGPDGRLRRAYAGNVEARGGRWEGIVPTALNDPKGRWKVRVREVVSGLETEVAFRLK